MVLLCDRFRRIMSTCLQQQKINSPVTLYDTACELGHNHILGQVSVLSTNINDYI